MVDNNFFLPFHHYDLNSIRLFADKYHIELIEYGNDEIGEHFLIIKDSEKKVLFSFVSVDKNNDGIVYMCVFNSKPLVTYQYHIIRTTNKDFLVHVDHQYDHYDANKRFLGKLPYHLYQLAKNTMNNEQIIVAHSTLDALRIFEANTSVSKE